MCQKVETFSEGDLVYMFVPHTSSLEIGTTLLQKDYGGPLVIDTVLDFTHYKLSYPKNR